MSNHFDDPRPDTKGRDSPRPAPLSVDPTTRSDLEVDRVAETDDFQLQDNPPPSREGHEPVPKAFGRYEVHRMLGRGGFAAVYAGYDRQLGRRVAIKVPHRRRLLSSEDVQQFAQEARRVAKLKHPAIVTVYDVGVQGDQAYIVSDWVQGTSLSNWLTRHRPSWQQAATIVAILADALAHAHAQSTVHRDVKPANVVLTQGLEPVLIDFGLGIDDSPEVASIPGEVLGTPEYMSPEQVRGKAHRIDGRTDIYSLGVLLYFMLCKRLPFRADELRELFRQICEDDPQPPRQLFPEIPPALENICLKAMAKEISNRYTTANDMASDLRRLLSAHGGCSSQEPLAEVGPPVTQSPEAQSPEAVAKRGERSAASGRSQPERRQVTMMFCTWDVSSPEQMSPEMLDPEDEHDVLIAYQQVCDSVVRRFEGTIVQSMERGMLICFGYPRGYEDAAQRAVRSALGILEEIPQLNQQLQDRHDVELVACCAIHTGQAVVTELASGKQGQPLTIVGEARNVATRLESVADPGTVVVTESTRQLVQGFFVCQSLGTHRLKGSLHPLEIHRVLGESQAVNRIEVGCSSGLSPLVGRDQEVGLLVERWEQTLEGMGQIVSLIGEAGIGKSRLVHVLKEHVLQSRADQPVSVVEWRCSSYYQNSGLYPATDFFQRTLQFRREDTPQQRRQKLAGYLQAYQLADPQTTALFADLLSIPLPGDFAPLNLSPQRQKEKTLEALLDWLSHHAARQPVLWIVEDLHWMDPSTLELLKMVADEGLSEGILALFTFRPDFTTPWTSRAHQSQVALNRLTRRQTADMMRRKLGTENLPDHILQQVIERTDGVPLFVEEFTKMVQESAVVREVNGQVQLSGTFPLHTIPATLQDLLMARLDRMAGVKELAQLGAALGREFSYELIQAVAPLEPSVLETELERLVEAELLYRKGRPPHCSYLFKHVLLQDAAYQSLLKTRRQEFHHQIARTLEERFPETVEAEPELLAHHYTEAGLIQQGITYWEKAGLRCHERFANAEAIGHLSRGLELIQTLEESSHRDQQELSFQIALGVSLVHANGYAAPEVGTVYERAYQLCQKIGDAKRLFYVTWGTWAWRLLRDELDLALELAEDLMRQARGLQDQGILVEACFGPGCTLFYRGDFAGSLHHCEQGLARYDPVPARVHAPHTGQHVAVSLQCYSAMPLWYLGYPDQALQRIEQALALSEQLADPISHAFALYHFAWIQFQLRQAEATHTTGRRLIALAQEQGFQFWEATGTLWCGAGQLLQGQLDQATDQIRRGLNSFRATGAEMGLPHYYAYLADAQHQSGQFEAALQALDQGLAASYKRHGLFHEAELYRLKGQFLWDRSPQHAAEAEICFQKALEIARHQQAKSWELRVATSLSRLWQQQGKHAQAHQLLLEVYSWFTEGFDTADLKDAKTCLENRLGS